jgi:hypothetical protein
MFKGLNGIRLGLTLALTTTFALVGCGGGGGGSTAPVTYTIGGTVSGLTGTLVLQNNGGDNLSLTTNGSFTFSKALSSGAAYAAAVLTQPSGEICTVSSGSGTASAKVTTVSVQCIVPWTGTKQMGAVGADTQALSDATDASGNVYVVGYTTGGLDGNTLIGTSDVFLTKYNSSGVKQYTKQLGVAGVDTYGYSVATDASGNVYAVGYTTGGLDGNLQTGTNDLFVTKYDSSGVKQFTRQLGVAGVNTYAYSVATDASGNVYVAGQTFGGLDGNTLTGTSDVFLTKYNSSGVKQYTQQLGVVGADTYSYWAATDASGNVYVSGTTTGGLDGNSLMGTSDVFVTKYNSSGVKQYTSQLGVAGLDTYGYSVATDASGNVFVSGQTFGGLDGNTLTGTSDVFVIKYNSGGVKQYTGQLGVAGADTVVNSVATDASGNVYVAGFSTGGFDGNMLTGTTDFFVTKYNSSGVKQYTRQLGVLGADTYGCSVATDGSGNAYVAGATYGGLDGNTLTGTTDFFVTKYDSNGVKQ